MTSSAGYLRFPHVVGDQLVFVADDDVWLVASSGGAATRLTSDRVPVARPRLSPDGTRVAWLSRRTGRPEAFVMPVSGGEATQLTFFGAQRTNLLGFAPDGRLVVNSTAGRPATAERWAHAIDLDSGRIEPLPYGPITGIAWGSGTGAGGAVLVVTGGARDAAEWKRYRGGTAGRLWHDKDGSGEFEPFLAELPGQLSMPVAQGGRYAFLSDFEGHGNVYSVAADGSELRRHTDHDQFYARQLAGDGSRLVYQHGGELWRLDSLAADSQPDRIEVTLPGARAGRAPVEVEPGKHLGGFSVDATGRAAAIEVRGAVFWLTTQDGPVRAIAADPGVRHRLPVLLNGAEPSTAYVTSADGPDGLEIAAPDGSRRRFGAGSFGRILELVAAPDGRQLALATHDGRVLTVDVASRAVTELERSQYGDSSGLTFSPDSRWLAYSCPQSVEDTRAIRLVELATGQQASITGERFLDTEPVFSPDGKYLAFLSARTFDPVYDAQVFDLSFTVGVRPFLVTLAAETASPFDPELSGRSIAAGPASTTDPSTEAPRVTVDLPGLADRVVPFPVRAGRLEGLAATKAGFSWLQKPIAGVLGDSRRPDDDIRAALQHWDLAKRTERELASHVDAFRVSGDGARILLRDKEGLRLVPADHKPAEDGDEVIKLDLGRLRLTIDPVAEGLQMLAETHRLLAEHFWIADMSGIDWPAVLDKYQPLAARAASRDDLIDILWELNGETGTSHSYVLEPELPADPRTAPGYLGADLSFDGQHWRVDRVLGSDHSSGKARSPLAAPGVGVLAGDILRAVNGRELDERGPAALLRGLADKPVELRVQHEDVTRSVVVVPLADELELRYLDQIADRRRRVHELSAGRIGYLHIPDMIASGWAAFHRDLRTEIGRDGLIVDTRNNSGGHTSQLVLEKLSRRGVARVVRRHGVLGDYPGDSPTGPMVSLCNEWAGSDGDIVNAGFKDLGLGPVIGVRTWGGVIGIDGRYQLVDGTRVTQPRYSFWFTSLGWSVENHGIDPDVVVEMPPQAWASGADPQLEAGVAHLLAVLSGRPSQPEPDLSTRPDLAPPALPPRP